MANGYEDRCVAFIDVLGFTDLVERSVSDPTFFHRLRDALLSVERHRAVWQQVQFQPPQADTFRSHAFSDSLIISDTLDNGITRLFVHVSQLCFTLLGSGILTRGAIAFGKLYHDDVAVFGPALIEAYRLEKDVAKYPRILVSDDVFQDSQNVLFVVDQDIPHSAYRLCDFLRRDFDRQYHLNYLTMVPFYPGQFLGADLPTLQTLLDRARRTIEDEFTAASRPDIQNKLGWLVEHYNELCVRAPNLPALRLEPLSFPDDELDPAATMIRRRAGTL